MGIWLDRGLLVGAVQDTLAGSQFHFALWRSSPIMPSSVIYGLEKGQLRLPV